MSFLVTASDDGHPDTYPAPASSGYGTGSTGLAPAANIAAAGLAPAANIAAAGLAPAARVPAMAAGSAGPADMAALAGGIPDGGEATPFVDPLVLQDLGAGLDDPAAARDFARDYIKLLDHRCRTLAAALERGDEPGALDAVLSLKTASSMVGAVRLSRLAGKVEEAVRCGDLGRANSFLPEVAEHGRETVDELQASQDLTEP